MSGDAPAEPVSTSPPKGAAGARLRKGLLIAAKFAVSALLIGYVLDRAGVAEVAGRLADVAPVAIVAALALFVVQAGICTARWRAVLAAIDAPLGFLKALEIFVISAFFSQALPSSIGGDAVRIYKSYRAGLTIAGAVHGIVLERVATVAGLVILVAATQPVFLSRVDASQAAWMGPLVAAVAVACVVGIVGLILLERLPMGVRRWRPAEWIVQLGADTRRLFAHPGHAAKALSWSVAGHANLSIAVYGLALGLGIQASPIECMALVPPILLVTTLPVSIGGWGVREAAMVVAFGFLGVPEASATALSILFGFLGVIASLPGGILWLRSDRDRPRP